MEACLSTGAHYLDTANYEPRDEAKFEYHWQWAYRDRFRDAGLMALLGSGFDPGVTSVFTTWLRKHHFDRIDTLDIRSEEHTSELQSLMRNSYAVFCLKKKNLVFRLLMLHNHKHDLLHAEHNVKFY